MVVRSVVPTSWPKVLILSLKRFAIRFEDGEVVTSKVPTDVSFETILLVQHGQPPFHLRGVIEHHGEEAAGGHYTAYVRATDNFWYFCDDRISPRGCRVSTDQVLRAQAYVLVYESS